MVHWLSHFLLFQNNKQKSKPYEFHKTIKGEEIPSATSTLMLFIYIDDMFSYHNPKGQEKLL